MEGCRFDVAAISNVTQDHLDFHGDMRSYIEAKALLFERYLSKRGCAVVNVDDPVSERFIEGAAKTGSRIVRVSSRLGRSSEEAEVRCEEVQCALDHTQLRIATPRGTIGVNMKLIGGFNVENALLATGIGVALDLPGDRIASGLENCGQVPGRLERVEGQGPQDPRVFVDYAHTPDAVEKLLATLRPLTEGRLIAVFGCGGDRDRGKRPLMARAVAEHADRVVATSDNPRTEDPERILDDVEVGLEDLSRFDVTELATVESGYARVTDRRAAIAKAIAMAGPADTVVLAGKGHEDYQIIGRDRLPFDDREEARRALGVAAAAAAPR